MFLPVGDSPNPPGRPWATYVLIGLNVLVYLVLFPQSLQPADPRDPALAEYVQVIAHERGASLPQLQQLVQQVSRYDLIVFDHGFRPSDPSLADMLTSMFLHGGLLHLLGNMLFLWIYGDNVEHRLGRLGFVAAYLLTGLAATAGDALLRMGSGIPSVGASGAISGVLGLYFLWFPRNRVRVFVFLFPFFMNVLSLPARWVLGFYVVAQNLLPVLLTSARGAGISHGAHLGGFVGGIGLAWLVDRLLQARPEADLRRRPEDPSAAVDSPRAFREALAHGRWDVAAEWFFGAAHGETRHAVSAAEKVALGRELASHGHPHAALAAFQRAIADHPVDAGRLGGHLGAARVLMGPLGNPTGAYQHLYAVLEAEPSVEQRHEARRLLDLLTGQLRHLPS